MAEKSDHDLLVEMNTKLDVMVNNVGDHEKRIRKVERLLWQATGAASFLGAGGAYTMIRAFGH